MELWIYLSTCLLPFVQCEPCPPGYVYDPSSGIYECQKCSYPGCLCTNLGNCKGCIEGYFMGSYICSSCPDQCMTCTNTTGCTSCKMGYIGTKCESKICANEHCKCLTNGTCGECLDGYYDLSNNCSSECNSKSASCSDRTTRKSCKQGRHGQLCDNSCSMGCKSHKCSQINWSCPCSLNFTGETCEQCVHGRYGILCEQLCANGCEKAQCNHEDGICNCVGKFVGEKCDHCSKGMRGTYCEHECSRCTNGDCDGSGSCISGCKDGYWKSDCSSACDHNCTKCSQSDGGCLLCATMDIFGSKCEFQCGIKCINRSCSMSGDCNLGCSTNTFGPKCDKPCPNNCNHIEGSSSCLQDGALCKFGCQNGYKGTSCEEELKFSPSGFDVDAALIGGGTVAVVCLTGTGTVLLVRYSIKRRRGNGQSPLYETTSSQATEMIYMYIPD